MNPPRRRRRLLLAFPAVGYAALILFLSSRPASSLPSTGVPSGDKWLHLVEYFLFGVLLLWPVRDFGMRGQALVVAVGASYAAFDEAFQTTVPGRHGDPADFAIDLVGLLLALTVRLAWRIAPAAAKTR